MHESLSSALAEARALGFLGPGPLDAHVASAKAFATPLAGLTGRALDLGSGGGVPGLLLADAFPDIEWLLLDGNRRRTSFLARTVAELGWGGRVSVLRAPAEEAAHRADLRGALDAVVARSFGPPPTVAECAAGFLRVGGLLVVSEPPSPDASRWPAAGLETLGLRLEEVGAVAVLRQVRPLDPTRPRPWRTLERHPAW